MESQSVVIVGAGMAGLTCAVALQEAGIQATVLEASSAPGGRVSSSVSSAGFVLERGFQVLLTASPSIQKWIDLPSLRPRAFGSGAHVWTGRRLVPVVDPFRHPAGFLRDVTSPVATPGDKVRLAREAGQAGRASWESANAAAKSLGHDLSIVEYLWTRGFSERFVDRIARPFWGGISLDPLLQSSAGLFLSSLHLFARGSAVLPRDGMVALPGQLASRLPAGSISLNRHVSAIVTENGRVCGVQTEAGLVEADVVVIATDPKSAEGLMKRSLGPLAGSGLPSVTVYLTGSDRPKTGPFLVLDGSRSLTVNHAAPLSEVQPSYAPEGQHLVAAVVVGEAAAGTDLDRIAAQARLDAATMLGNAPGSWQIFDVHQDLFSQYAQPPGFYAKLPSNITALQNLYLASELTVDSSYNGAMLSGETVAALIARGFALHAAGAAA